MGHERRIFVDSAKINQEIVLGKEDTHYLTSVLRLAAGSPIVIVDRSAEQSYEAFIVGIEPSVTVKISSRREGTGYISKVSALIYAFCKHDSNEFALEKSTELGVQAVWFFQAERSVVKLGDDRDQKKKLARFEKIAEAAARQSGRISVPGIRFFSSLQALVNALNDDLQEPQFELKLVAALTEKTFDVSELRGQIQSARGLAVAVGPEGDFSPTEYEIFDKNEFLSITLGGNRLRAETAAITAIAAIDAVSR